MALEVAVRSREDTPVALPQVCCYCLQPASESVRFKLPHRRRKTGVSRVPTPPNYVEAPYCAEHGPLAHRFERYAGRLSVGLLVLGVLAAIAFDLALGRTLRALGGAAWWCVTVLAWAAIAALAVMSYRRIMRLLQRRHPALADYFYTGCLGIDARARSTADTVDGAVQIVELVFTFSNHAYASRVAEEHGAEARSPDPG